MSKNYKKFTILKNRIFRILSVFLITLMPSVAFPFFPLLGGAGLLSPVLGGVVNAKVAKAKAMLSQVDGIVFSVELFLTIASLLLLLVFGAWIIKTVKKIRIRRKTKNVLVLLTSIQTDIALSKNKITLSENKSKIEESKKNLIVLLMRELEKRFFGKKLGEQLKKRMIKILTLIKKEKIDNDTQLIFIDQLIRKFVVINL